MGLLDGIQSPEGEEDADFFAGGCSSVGEHEGGKGFVEVVAEKYECLALGICYGLCGLCCKGYAFFDLYDVYA